MSRNIGTTQIAQRSTAGGSHRLIGLFAACAIAVLAGCTQGPGGGGIGLASGQEPDPATVDFPIFYVRHQVPEDEDDLTRLRPFVEDDEYAASLWKRDRASPGAPEVDITARLNLLEGADPDDRYDIKDLEVSHDGLRVAFAMRGPLDDIDEEEDPPTWNIWEYDLATDTLRRVISSDIIAEEGQDVGPSYLPDGRIVFSSTRQRQSKAILLDEGKSQFEASNESGNESAFLLHVMNADGTGIKQITFNASSDIDPTVLQNGRVLFARWDRTSGGDALHLYTSNPDGTDTQLHYGAISHLTGTNATGTDNARIEFVRAREMSNGRLMVLTRPADGTDIDFGGNLVIIDANTYVENTQALAVNGALPGPAQTPATLNRVTTIPGPSRDGRFTSGFPLWDGSGRILVSWSQCRLLDVNGADPTRIIPCPDDVTDVPPEQMAAPLYSIWMFNPAQNTILPIMPPVEGVMVTEAVAAQPRTPLPIVILDKQAPGDLDADLVAEGAGLLAIRSVYDITGNPNRTAAMSQAQIANSSNPNNATYDTRTIRFIRLEKRVSIPDDDDLADPDNAAFGGSNMMREILGYAPVEPDGSVRMKVPANVAFQLSLLDANGQRIGARHNSWLHVRPGEVLECNGCHVRQPVTAVPNANPAMRPTSHGRVGSFNSVYAGATTTGGAFPGTVLTISPEAGDTMARARSRAGSSCPDASMNERCGLQSIRPSADVVYNEIWDPAAQPDDSFAFNYSALNTPSPANPNCFPVWSPTCRATIHYAGIGTRAGHIHPLWLTLRQVIDVDGVTVLQDNTCTTCHNRLNAAGAVQLPAGDLELTPGQCNQEPLYENSYCQLFFDRPDLELVDGAVVQRQEVITNPDGTTTIILFELPPSMQANNARNSRFFAEMNSATHAGMLSPAELRLLSEWLDIGAQYYNDPFPPTPQN